MKKIKEVLLFVIVLVLLVGVASAADIQNKSTSDTITTQSTDINTKKTVQNTNTLTDNIEENIINEKKINKKEKNLKTTSQTHNVNDYDQLSDAMNSNDEDVTINIKSNITLTDSPWLNPNIKTLTINGNSYTINGDNKYQFLNITSNQLVNINNITITNCHALGNGGAISNNHGNLTITQSNLNNNTATGQGQYGKGYGGAIYNNGGTLTITQSNLKNNTANYGGAINNNNGNITIIDSNITQNNATGEYGRGGAIYSNGGTLNITDSNITQNKATGQQNDGGGGAIYNTGSGTLNITQSNLTHNTATGHGLIGNGYGGAIYNEGTLTITESNLTQNNATGQGKIGKGCGGAIYNSGTLNITQSNLTQNTATGQNRNGYGGAIYNTGSGTTTNSNTLFYNNTPANFIINQENHIELTTNDNYITVETFTIIVNDAEIGTGTGTSEFNNFIVKGDNIKLIVNGTNMINNTYILRSNTRNISDYPGLIAAIEEAKQNQYNQFIINLQPGGDYNATGNILYENSLTKDITINGNRQTLNGQNTYQFIQIAQEHNLTLTNITITNYTAEWGGAINNNGNLTITNTNLTQNTANGQGQNGNGYGGAIYNDYGTLTITQSNITQNKATGQRYGYGGAIYNKGTLTITQSNLTQNTATGQNFGFGGAIYNPGTINITQSNLTQNTATGQQDGFGGAIYNYGTLTITESNLTHNTATGQQDGVGGAIYNSGNLTITQSNLTQNTATGQYGYGGAIYNYNRGNLTITQSNLTQNTATGQYGYGGAIYNNGGTNTISNTLFYNNAPANFIINQDNHIELTTNDNYITVSTFTIIEDEKQVYQGTMENLGEYTVSPDSLNVKLIVNGTDQNTIDNIFILRKIKEVNITCYDELVNAIKEAQEEQYDKYIINLKPGNYNANQNITWNESATRKITINGNRQTLNGQNTYQFIQIAQEHNLTLTNITITNYTAENGGAIFNSGNLTIINSTLTQNTATSQILGEGGAIYNNGTLTITQTNLTQNTANGQYGDGGAIYNTGTLTITQTNLTHNTANGQNGNGVGGAIYNDYRSTLTITQTNLTQNTANGQYGYGGAIYNTGTLTITQTNLTQNTANGQYGYGGAICNYWGAATVYNNTFTNNLAKSATGPAIIDEGRETSIHDNINADSSKYSSTIYTNNVIGDEVYLVSITFNTFDDKPRNTSIIISTNNTTIPTVTDMINITLELKDDFNLPVTEETITVTINENKTLLTTDSSGMASMEYQVMSNETIINATYHGKKDTYNENNTVLTLLAEKIETKLLVDDISTAVGKTFTINGTLLDINDKPVKEASVNITVNGSTKTATTNTTGQFNITFTLDQMGEYPITTIFYENNGYKESTNSTAKVTASKTDTKLTLEVSNTTPINNTVVTITANLTDINNNPLINQPVTITIGDEVFNLNTDENGIIIKEYMTHEVGKQNITVTYNGNNMYNANSTTTTINVYKIDTKLTLTVSNSTPINSTNITITVRLTDTNGNKLVNQDITITTDEESFNLKTNNEGIVTQTYTPTTLGKQTITATYNGNSQYINSNATTNITVKKINTKLAVKVSNTTPINNTAITITATLTDADNKAVANQNITLNVAGKIFNVKTNSNGVATQTYTPIKVETQNITATYKGDSRYNNSTATTNITVKKINTKIDLKVSNTTPINNTPINITVTLTDADNNKLANQQVTLNINGKTVTAKTNTNGIITQTYTPTQVETQNITATYTGDSRYNNSTKTIQITVKNKIKTKATVNPAIGVIGEKLIIKATVTDTNGNNVNEGNLIFKVNGVTIKDNGKLTGSFNPLKIKVVNGVATATIIPDINMTNAKNITAYYVGTTIYNASTSSPASINISKRNATIEVTTNKKIIKQGQILTITAKIYDTTNGKKTSNITRYQDEYVYFKVNGITLKDANGEMLKVKIINGTATVNYTIPLGISCVTDTQSMTPKNHTIQVGLYNKNYQNIMTKTPTFQVERSNITINIANATINNKTHTLSMKITIKDYLKNTVIGPNKLVIKVNGLTLKNGTNVQYYYTTDGVLNLKNIPIPTAKNYTSIEVITQDRLAYNSQRNTTKVIKITN